MRSFRFESSKKYFSLSDGLTRIPSQVTLKENIPPGIIRDSKLTYMDLVKYFGRRESARRQLFRNSDSDDDALNNSNDTCHDK